MSSVEHPPECIECGSSRKETVEHHTNYHDDTTVPMCRACHQKVHADKSHPLYPEGEPAQTCLRLTERMADELFDRKRRGESYEDVIWRLIEQADAAEDCDE